MLRVEGLSRGFSGLLVLHELSFELAPGEGAAVVGPNGSGKTTLLRCVAGTDLPDAGRITMNGFPVLETSPDTRAAMACVLDDVDFFPDLSVGEHLALCALAHGAPVEIVEPVLAELGITEQRDQLPATLSSGQKRRLALASCFVRPRSLLVLDEPEQRLDVEGRAWLASRLNAEKANGVSVLMASHDPELIEAVADVYIEVGL
ncbi:MULTISPECIES: ABC transporter ATP-binding protein [unclassified Kutzneria]|uniref:ABC transporter ATP-binding protein n=1 Tax=unclassified Kutzneria TaxID=2621979 RepID=UPI0004B47DA1|nr:ABC transporter ATP-binding protein [Kutzneria sp. 744]